jgi:hypothetical protein
MSRYTSKCNLIEAYKEDVTFRQNFHKIWKFPNVFRSDFLHRTSRKLDDDFHFADFQEARIFVDI